MIPDPLVTMEHVRTVGYRERHDGKTFCAAGVRAWCATHSIDYLQLVREGVPASIIEKTDSWGEMSAAEARNEHGRE